MDYQSQDGQTFIKQLAHFVRTHEKALANALQLQRRPPPRKKDGSSGTATDNHGLPPPSPSVGSMQPPAASASSSALASAFSLPSLSFASTNVKPQKLILNLNHLYYLLTRFEELNINVGPMNVRLENLHADNAHSNYVSFLSNSHRSRRSADNLSIHSVSSVRSVMSTMSTLWSTFGLGGSSTNNRTEKAKAQQESDLKYLYSAFTKIPCLRLVPPDRNKLIQGFEEFPFDTAVPIVAFKNLSALEMVDVDIRSVYGWDQIAERVRSLVIRRGQIDDPAELIIAIVLDDIDRRRRRSSKNAPSPITWNASAVFEGPPSPPGESPKNDVIGSSADTAPKAVEMSRGPSASSHSPRSGSRPRSISPKRPSSSRNSTSRHHSHHNQQPRGRRSDSGSSKSSATSALQSSQVLNPMSSLPPNKWRFLRHLSLSDNSLTNISSTSLYPLANTLTSLDLSENLLTTVPDALAILTSLRALNLSGNMIESLHSVSKLIFPSILALNLRRNRLQSLAGIEGLNTVERLDLRENRIADPAELARLTGAPNISEVWIAANPLTKSYYSSYRVTIFNLFRNTPGYEEDIVLDSQGPSSSEKRYLIDRVVAEPPPPPPVISKRPSALVKEAPVIVDQRETLKTEKSNDGMLDRFPPRQDLDYAVIAKPARKKGQKRSRMVELSRGDSNATAPDYSAPSVVVRQKSNASTPERLQSKPLPPSPTPSAPTPPRESPTSPPPPALPSTLLPPPPKLDHSALLAQYAAMAPPPAPSPRQISSPPSIPSIMLPSEALARNGPIPNRGANPPLSPPPLTITTAPTEGSDWNVRGDEYRKKIEALRSEVGNGWLTVLSDDQWDSHRLASPGGEFTPTPTTASTVKPSPITPVSNQQYNDEYTRSYVRQPRNFQEIKASDS